MSRTPASDPSLARIAKRLLWQGTPQLKVAALTGLSQSTISRIVNGKLHASIPWPNGETGAQPDKNTKDERWSAESRRFISYPTEVQKSILHAVNARRGDVGLPPIPERSEKYEALLNPAFEEESQDYDYVEIYEAEDKRLSTIVEEFDALVAEQRTQIRQTDIRNILSDTRECDPRTDPPPDPPPSEWKKLPWREVIALDPRNPLVHEGLENKPLQEAICIVFHEIPHEDWRQPFVRRLVNNVLKRNTMSQNVTKREDNETSH